MDYLLLEEGNGYREFPVIDGKAVGITDCAVQKLPSFCWQQEKEGMNVYLISGTSWYFRKKDKIFITEHGADINIEGLQAKIILSGNRLFIIGCGQIWRNGKKEVSAGSNPEYTVSSGDEFLIDKLFLTVLEDDIEVRTIEKDFSTELPYKNVPESHDEDFPHYRRSPRLIKRVSTEKVAIEKAPEMERAPKGSIVQLVLPPFIMLLITVAISILMKRGLYVVISITATVMGMITSIIRFFTDRKERKEKNRKLKENYGKYLLKKRKELHHLQKQEMAAYDYNFASLKQIEKMVSSYSSRIYEKNLLDEDFLQIKLGEMRDKTSYSIQINVDELGMEEGEFEKEIREMESEFGYLDKKPVIIDLKRAHLGLVGEKKNIHEQLKQMIVQLAFYQSYHDMEFVAILDKKYDEDFAWTKWLPHFRISAINAYGYINSEKMRDQVLGSMHQILKERKNKLEENKKEARFSPHYVFIIDEPKLIMDHAIMEYLDKSGEELGFSIIYTTYQRANLPENIKTVLMLNNHEDGVLLLNQGVVVDKKLRLNHIGDVNLEGIARNLSVLIHEQGVISQIPENITFFEMYGIHHPEELHATARWNRNESHKSLAVPLGVRSKDDIVNLNLHEKAHGPHGLIAGTTGSGKSEIIQSYILSLAVNFHPYEVGFLLIDYKGGGMSSLFKGLPHLLGTITNLDGNESLRAMASIKSELERRQRIFNKYNVNHINSYNKLFKLGKAAEPIPHLFLISDEFAELKKEQPGFMDELISTARIGRSLGVHLILATQKPSGVVNDQIWTNSRFKLALKVQNEADSKEIIKTGDAAFITQPGRAYLQVGNNEIYELFQSAWSGATYSEEHVEVKDDRVYIINELGQGELVNGDLSEGGEPTQIKDTQLDVTVRYLAEEFTKSGMKPVEKPWLSSLSDQIVSPYATLSDRKKSLEERDLDLKIPLGIVDIPEEQSQVEYVIDLLDGGNFVYFASSGYGKSTVLTTAILSLAVKNRVDQVYFYILDFGNNALMPLNMLPHTADYITFDDDEKLSKFFRIISEEIKHRKKLLAECMVQNFDVYNQCNEKKMNAIAVVVDNFDVVKEKGFEAEEFFTKLSRDGAGLGIYLLVTATRSSGIRYATLNNFRNKVAGYMYETTEATSIVGKSNYELPEIKGRAMVKMETTNVMQMYTMAECKNQIQYNQAIKDLIGQIIEQNPGDSAPRIPILPEVFSEDMFCQFSTMDQTSIALGLEIEDVSIRGIKEGQTPFLILGEASKGKTNIIRVILNQLCGDNIVYLFDNRKLELYDYQSRDGVQYIEKDEFDTFADELMSSCKIRMQEYKKELVMNPRLSMAEYLKNQPKEYIVIDDGEIFIDWAGEYVKRYGNFLQEAAEAGVSIILAIQPAKLKGFDEISKWLKSSMNGLLLSAQGSINVFSVVSMKEYPAFGDGLLFTDGTYEKIKLPKSIER